MVELNYAQSKTDNFTRSERIALSNLMDRTDIVINKADKGSTVVVLDRQQYVEDDLKHLSDTTVYQPLTADITPSIKRSICTKLHGLYVTGMLDKQMRVFCEPPKEHRTSSLYFLKKIHKNPMGIRPIVSSCSSVTENISQFVDTWLQPLMRNLPAFIKDTSEFINLIERTPFPESCLLASIDVSSLYTNIPHNEGKLAAMRALADVENPDPYQPPAEVIGELIEIVLQNNVFEFNGKYYLQKQGTAMGTKMAPAYANIFMGNLEPKLQAVGKDNILTWKRFIDDIFIVWTGTGEEFSTFMDTINTLHHSIKFTHECSETQITVLDITLYKGARFQENGILDIKTHIKPTNKQLYVHASSYHPPCTGKSIAIGETNRYIRTNSDEQHFNHMVNQLHTKLLQRGYKSSAVKAHTSSLSFSNRSHTLRTNQTLLSPSFLPHHTVTK